MGPFNESPFAMVKSTARQSNSPLGQSPLGRASTFADMANPLRHRRSSTFSESVDSARNSIKSSTEDLLLPKATSPDLETSHEPSHWHSVPLALALLPAVGGLFFNNGSAIVTDLSLLGLAAVFLNWSVRLPWDWYHSARSTQIEDPPATNDGYTTNTSDTIIEEGSEEEEQRSPPATPFSGNKGSADKHPEPSPSQKSASNELRIHELLALLMCFLFPAAGAWLLHHIRSQLSRPSEGLVSNYNLTVFLLASELRPLSHLIKLVQARTLFLQRTVSSNFSSNPPSPASSSAVSDLQTRLTELEIHIAHTTTNGTTAKSPPQDTITAVRKSLQPDLDALNRAVRRYEKRATILALQTESRLQELEKRLGDAITLAAAAERSSQSSRQRRGSIGLGMFFDWLAAVMLLPMQMSWAVASLPGRVVGSTVVWVEGYVGQKVRREMRTAGRSSEEGRGGEKRRVPGRGQKKAI